MENRQTQVFKSWGKAAFGRICWGDLERSSEDQTAKTQSMSFCVDQKRKGPSNRVNEGPPLASSVDEEPPPFNIFQPILEEKTDL